MKVGSKVGVRTDSGSNMLVSADRLPERLANNSSMSGLKVMVVAVHNAISKSKARLCAVMT